MPALGLAQMFYPKAFAREVFAIEAETSEDVNEAVSLFEPLLGSRDLAVAVAIFSFAYTRQDKAMGVVIVSGTVLCYADAVAIYVRRGLGGVSSGHWISSLSMLTSLPEQCSSTLHWCDYLGGHWACIDVELNMLHLPGPNGRRSGNSVGSYGVILDSEAESRSDLSSPSRLASPMRGH